MVFFGAGPAERSRRPTGRNKKNTLHTRGRQETNDTGHEQKVATTKNPDSLTAALDRDAHSLLFRGDFSGWCFFLLQPRADAHSPTAVLGGDAPRRCGAFFCCGPARTGWCFFLLWPRPDAHSLTVGWGDFGKALVFFWLRPRRTRRASNIGSKKPPGPQQKKKTPLPPKTQQVTELRKTKHG